MSSSRSSLAIKVRPSLVPVSFLLALAAGDRAWAQQTEAAKLFPPSKFDTSITGSDVAISGAWALVGDHTAGVGGQVYFFRRGPGGWTLQQVERGFQSSTFGSVAIDGETAVVGAHLWDFGNTWRGKAYVYEWQGGSWMPVENFLPPKLDDWSVFGWDVAISGDVIVVGAPGADAVIKDGGEVFIYERVKGVWALVKRLQLPSVPKTLSWDYRFLGASVAVDGDLMVAGAPGKTGAAFVYERGPTG
ncbi:MAG: FG-GAP repeat protein, partial [Planctomycetota bacterium]